MGLPLYLAMTAGEIHAAEHLPGKLAYMACHFSPYSTGLSNLPQSLPPGSLLMVNDRIPILEHDAARIAEQLQEAVDSLCCEGIVLDLQRKDCPAQRTLCRHLVQTLSCPVAISESYAQELPCPVFLSAPAVNFPLSEYIAPYEDREIWLEAALDAQGFSVREAGCTSFPLSPEPPASCSADNGLHCRYTVEESEKAVRFSLWRTADDLRDMLFHAEALGITKSIGLHQQLKDMPWD